MGKRRPPRTNGPDELGIPDVAILFNATPGVNLLLAADAPHFTMLAASDERLTATRTTREDTLGRPLFEVFADDNPDNAEPSGVARLRASLETVLRTKLPHRMEVQRYDLQCPDGTWEVRHWAPHNIPVLGADGAVRYIVHHVEDVTEVVRKTVVYERLQDDFAGSEDARRALELSNARLLVKQHELERARAAMRGLVEAVTDGFVAFDEHLQFTYVNRRAAEMWQRHPDALLGRTPFEVWPDADSSVLIPSLRRVLTTRAPEVQEGYSSTLGRLIGLRVYPAPDGGVVAFFADLTDRDRAEKAATFLAEASQLLASSTDCEAMLATLADAAVPRLADWCAVDIMAAPDATAWPPKMARVAAVHRDPEKLLLAKTLTTRFPQDWSRDTGSPRVIRTGEPMMIREVTDEILHAGAQNDEHHALLRALDIRSIIIVPLISRDRVLGTMTLVMAASNRRFEDADLALAADLGRRAGVALDNALLLRDVGEANALKTEFLRMISHELRQPLNAMRGYLGLWKEGLRGQLSASMQDDVARLSQNQEHLATLIEDLLSFTRLEAGQLEVDRAVVPVEPIFTAVEAMVRPEMDTRGVRFSYLPCGPDVAVLGDRNRIIQCCLNLVTNAMRATAPEGFVRMRCVPSRDATSIEVADTGRGIPADKLEAIFDHFVQVGRALNAPKEGAGLGLAISRGLAKAMGGTLTVASVPGEGSTFSLCLLNAPLLAGD